MSEHEISCIVIRHDASRQERLENALRSSDFNIKCWYARDLSELKTLLTNLPMILFCPSGKINEYEQKLLTVLQQLAPDCILANVTTEHWKGLTTSRDGGTDICSVSTNQSIRLQQQIDYLCAYARLKAEFRQCKHLLSIAELRSQWLVDYAREAVAYIAKGRHLHVNIAYLSLFDFNSEAEALATEVLRLVRKDEHKIFIPLSLEAEQGASPSNKLLMNLKTRTGQSFRAEIRFIPSVYRGRRCIQLHVHPLLRSSDNQQAHAKNSTAALPENPWEKRSSATLQLQHQQQKQLQSNSHESHLPHRIMQDEFHGKTQRISQGFEKRLHPNFRELLNLRGNDQAALLAAEPWLQYTKKVRVDYVQLLANAHDHSSRFRIDYWNLVATIKYLGARQNSPLKQQVLVTLGNWVFDDVKRLARLIKLLQKSRKVNPELVLAFNAESCMRYRRAAIKLLPLINRLGVNLLLDAVKEESREFAALLEISGAKLVRTHETHTQQMVGKVVITRPLQMLLQQMDGSRVSVIVDGVQDINSLNLLCETTAGYLQGPILDKFSR